MKNSRRFVAAVVLVVAVAAIGFGSLTFAKGKPGPGGKCRNRLIFCLDVWDPVQCDNGVVYSNQCYANRACATGCVSTGGGPVEL